MKTEIQIKEQIERMKEETKALQELRVMIEKNNPKVEAIDRKLLVTDMKRTELEWVLE